MTKKKNNRTLGGQLLHPTADLTLADRHDELADTSELRRVVVPNAPEVLGTANAAAVVDELEDTGEFLALSSELLNGAAPSPSPMPGPLNGLPASPDGQVSFWLNHLASEIERLQAKWNQVDAELKVREARIDELRRELEAKDVSLEGLARDLNGVTAAKSESDRGLASAESRLAELLSSQAQTEARLAERHQELEAAKTHYAELQLQLAAAKAEIEQLQQRGAQEKLATADASKRTDDLAANNGELRETIEVLESYIDRRKEGWTKLNDKLTEYQDSLVTAGHAANAQARKIAEHEKAKEALSQQVLELERRGAELSSRLKDREAAYKELQAKLADQIDAASQLRSELETLVKKNAETIAQLDHQTQLAAAQAREITARDGTIAALETARDEHRRLAAEVEAVNKQRAARVAELETALQERTKQIDELSLALEERRKAALLLTSEVSSRDTRLARLEEAAREDTNALKELRDDLERIGRERRDVATGLNVAESRVAELSRLLGEATREIQELNAHGAERVKLVAQLEADLLAKQKALDLLDRNVQLINNLGASLQDFDRVFPRGAQPLSADPAPVDPPVTAQPDRAPIVMKAPADAPRFARSLLLGMGDEEGHTYPIEKDDTTIGRSALSDIVIQNPYISRVHARIFRRDADTLIEDPGSKNGILVNSRPIEHRAILHDGDIISLGGALELRYVDSLAHEGLAPHTRH